jgi:hypothetical protein
MVTRCGRLRIAEGLIEYGVPQVADRHEPVVSSLLRWVLGQAAPHAARLDADLKRIYFTLRHPPRARDGQDAVTRKLLVRLLIILRDHISPAPVAAG